MSRFSISARAVLAVALLAAAPALWAQNAAVVNNKPIPKAKVDEFVQALVAQGRPDTPELRAAVREELIARELFVQEAERKGLTRNADVQRQLDATRQQILIRRWFATTSRAIRSRKRTSRPSTTRWPSRTPRRSTRRATSSSRRKRPPSRSSSSSRRARSSRIWPSSRRTPARPAMAGISTGTRPARSSSPSPTRWSRSRRASTPRRRCSHSSAGT